MRVAVNIPTYLVFNTADRKLKAGHSGPMKPLFASLDKGIALSWAEVLFGHKGFENPSWVEQQNGDMIYGHLLVRVGTTMVDLDKRPRE